MKDPDEKPCAACKEPIRADALICPLCRTPQQRSALTVVVNILKWAGGIAAVVSLVLASIQVYYYFEAFREKKSLLKELVAAAKIQQASGDYDQALALLEEAGRLDPFYRDARHARVDLGMKLIRTKRFWQKETPDTVNRILPDLVRSAAAFTGQKSADINAHIAWAYILLMESRPGKFSVAPYFDRAEALDKENVFAHAFQGYWVLSSANTIDDSRPADPDARVKAAMTHYTRALDQGREQAFVRKLQIWGLLKVTGSARTRLELFRVAMALKENGESVDRNLRLRLIERYDCFASDHQSGVELSRLALAQLGPEGLLETFTWLYRDEKDIHLPGNVHFERYHYTLAYLTRAAGDRETAARRYRELYQKLRGSSMYRDYILREIRNINAPSK